MTTKSPTVYECLLAVNYAQSDGVKRFAHTILAGMKGIPEAKARAALDELVAAKVAATTRAGNYRLLPVGKRLLWQGPGVTLPQLNQRLKRAKK